MGKATEGGNFGSPFMSSKIFGDAVSKSHQVLFIVCLKRLSFSTIHMRLKQAYWEHDKSTDYYGFFYYA